VERVIVAGRSVTDALFASRTLLEPVGYSSVKRTPVTPKDFEIVGEAGPKRVIGIVPDRIITDDLTLDVPAMDGTLIAAPEKGLHKLAVLARHGVNNNIGRGFVKGFGQMDGALASSVGHDAHNLCTVGSNDRDITVAINTLIQLQGGFVAVQNGKVLGTLPLPVAGLMSDQPFEKVAEDLTVLRAAVKEMGCPLAEPFLQLAFLPLPVIPHLKMTDFGLVDVDAFELVSL